MARLSFANEGQDYSVGSSWTSRVTRSSLRTASNGTTSTAPTSHAEYSNASPSASKVDLTTQRRKLSRVPNSTLSYNANSISEPELRTHSIDLRTASVSASTTRNVSGVSGDTTLVNSTNQSRVQILDHGACAPDFDGHAEASSEDDDQIGCRGLKRRRSTRLEEALKDAATSLAKRSRTTLENGKEKMKQLNTRNRRDSFRPRQSVFDLIELAPQEPLRKKARLDSATLSDPSPAETRVINAQPKVKRWQSVGLYVGQERDFRADMSETKNMLRRKSEAIGNVKPENRVLPLPMFAGQRLLESKSYRDFELPFDVYSPLPQRQPKPDEWRKTQSNRFVEDAAAVWKNVKGLAPSKCICTRKLGCDENCLNRTMFYECNESNCAIGASFCSNRAFAELENRKDGQDRGKDFRKYNIGVEVMQTTCRGFGVRANRTFMPNQIIVEYAGEIVTQDECDRRMNEEYKNNECYYLMSFTQNMIIDATRGSIARFVNHSCEPNCRMEMWIVNGKPRMALFAGRRGIMTGEELTYDYNFDPFSRKNVQECRCGTASCRGILGPKTKEDRTKPLKAQEASSILAGAKRKLKEMLSGAGSTDAEEARRERAVLKKRKIASVGRSALVEVARQVSGSQPTKHEFETAEDDEMNATLKPQRRVLQKRPTASFLPELSDAGGLLSSKPSHNSLSLARRRSSRTSTAITRIASALKRKASLLNPRSSTRTTSTATTLGLGNTSLSTSHFSHPNTTTRSQARSTQYLNPSTSHSQQSTYHDKSPQLPEIDLEPSFLASEYNPRRKAKTSTPTTKGTTTTTTHDQWSPSSVYPDPHPSGENRNVTPHRSASVHSTVASVREGVVRSVRGPRRAVAMARMGLGKAGVEEAGRSIRFVLGDEGAL